TVPVVAVGSGSEPEAAEPGAAEPGAAESEEVDLASVEASALAGLAGAGIPGHAPSALTRSSGVTGLSGVSGGASTETFLTKNRLGRDNHFVSLEKRSEALEHPAITGASESNSSNNGVRSWPWFFTTVSSKTRLSPQRLALSDGPTITLGRDHG
ncbi:MAG: hypothetical protein ACREDL_00830, partial [Bradyrhizobium sp.]